MPVLALGAVDLVALIIALAVILVLGALWVLVKPIQTALGNIPVIGPQIGSALTNGLEDAIRAVLGAYDRMSHAVGHFFWALAVGWWHMTWQNVQTLIHLGAKVVAVAESLAGWVVTAYNDAVFFATLALNAAEALFATAVNDAVFYAALALHSAEALFFTAEADIAAAAHTALNEAEWFAAVAEADIASVAATLGHDITVAADDVRSEAVTLFGQAEAAIAGVAAGVAAEVQTLTGDIAGIETQLGPLVGALPLLGAIPLIQSAVQALTTEAETCVKPLCDTVTPSAGQLGKLGQFLQGLETLGVDVLVTGLFAEAIANPGGLARDTVTVIETLGDPVITGIRDLTGL